MCLQNLHVVLLLIFLMIFLVYEICSLFADWWIWWSQKHLMCTSNWFYLALITLTVITVARYFSKDSLQPPMYVLNIYGSSKCVRKSVFECYCLNESSINQTFSWMTFSDPFFHLQMKFSVGTEKDINKSKWV